MKRKLLIASVLVIVIASLSLGTLAYFNSSTIAHNVITSGNIDIELVEKTKDGDALIDFPEGGIKGVLPGTDVSKIVTVKNRGSGTAWIRVKVTSQITGKEALPDAIEIGGEKIPVMTFAIGNDWIDGGDGYYYYKNPVATGGTTTALLEQVHFAKEMGNEYQNCTANLIVEAQAVQTANNGETVLAAAGWPAEDHE